MTDEPQSPLVRLNTSFTSSHSGSAELSPTVASNGHGDEARVLSSPSSNGDAGSADVVDFGMPFKRRAPTVVTETGEEAVIKPVPFDLGRYEQRRGGNVFVFNFVDFGNPSLPSRRGSDRDLEAIQTQLTLLDYDIFGSTSTHQTPLKKRAFEHRLRQIARDEFKCDDATRQHADCDFLMFFILSHGDMDANDFVIHTYDEHMSVRTLVDMFSGESCPTLADKPKLFFFQACQGDNIDPGVSVVQHDGMSPRRRAQTRIIPSNANILMGYSTIPGHFSYRNDGGSWYIQAFCSELQAVIEKKERVEIHEFLVRVNQSVAYNKAAYCPSNKLMHNTKQCCSFTSRLLKRFFIEAPQLKSDTN